MNIYKKLMGARLKLQGMKLSKSGHNKFAGYQYFELGDFLPSVQTIFADIGLCGVVSFSADIATLTIYETEGDGSVAFTSPMGSAALKGCHEVQNIGAVETYQRRYLWVTAMEIVEHDALDSATGNGANGTVSPITPTAGVWDGIGEEEKQFLMDIAIEVIGYIESGDIVNAVDALEEKKLDAEEKIALWTRFDSKQRSAMKREVESRKEQKATSITPA